MIERIPRWIVTGPTNAEGEDGTIGWTLGILLWWRTWALVTITIGGAVVAGILPNHLPALGWLFVYLIGIAVGCLTLRVSPRYTVTKNY